MIETIYRCDLCRRAESPERVLGFAWDHPGAPPVGLRRRLPAQAEHHLCLACVVDIARIAPPDGAKTQGEDRP